MPKSVNNIFYNKLKFSKMLDAYERASKNKHKCKEVIMYELDLANNLIVTLKQLYSGTYKVGLYRQFRIYEPKERIIQSLPFRDRIVQQWYVEEFIKPIFVPKFIQDTYACLEERGVHSSVKKLNKYMYEYSKKNEDFYILKCDISKFFYSINKEILYGIIKRYVRDKAFLKLTKQLIYHDNKKVGIPIGNYTSQYFANIYLNVLDHFVKEELKIEYYVRYMDDFVLLLEDKEGCKKTLEILKKFLEERLELKLNKKTNYFRGSQGVNFCGYKIYKTHIMLKKENKKKIKNKIKKWNKLYYNKKLDLKNTTIKLNSWIGHAQNADTFFLVNKMIRRCEWLYNENTYGWEKNNE